MSGSSRGYRDRSLEKPPGVGRAPGDEHPNGVARRSAARVLHALDDVLPGATPAP